MSFTLEIKDELARIQNEKPCCDLAQLSGFVCFAGSVTYENNAPQLKITTESEAAAKRCQSLIKRIFDFENGVEFTKSRSGSHTLFVDSPEMVRLILDKLGLFDDEFSGHITFRVNKKLTKQPCCKRAFVRGAFLGGGSAVNPEKGYHLELATHHNALSGGLEEIFTYFSLSAKTVKRKSNYVTYFKNSEDISDVLSIIGAHKNMMEFANVRIVKDTRNNINRKVNCETANLDKTLNAAFLQIDAINKIKSAGKLESLPEALYEAAMLRLGNPDASLGTLAQLSKSKVSRSGLSHRLKKITEIAENLTENNNG